MKDEEISVWRNGRGESFVNPFMKKVWDHNVEIAIEATKMGFQEIQFDYVRSPEGFEKAMMRSYISYETYEESELNPRTRSVEASRILSPMHLNN